MPWPLYPQKRHGTHYIGGWVGPMASLDGRGKSCPHRDLIPGLSSCCTDWAIPDHPYAGNHRLNKVLCTTVNGIRFPKIMHTTSTLQYTLLVSTNHTALFTRTIKTLFGTRQEQNSDKTGMWKYPPEQWSSRELSGRIQQAKLSGGPFQYSEDVFGLSFQDNLLIHKM
jgi:hypothetical protein